MTSDPLQALLQASQQTVNNLPPSSRYYPVPIATFQRPDGTGIAYFRRRIILEARFAELVSLFSVKEGDRLDNIAATTIGDPEQFWQIADANITIAPEELTDHPGTVLRITKPAGLGTF